MRKGLSLTMVGGVILAIVGVTVLLAVFSSSFGNAFETGFCRIYTSVSYIFPGTAPAPGGCGGGNEVAYQTLEATDVDQLALLVSSAVLNCWDQYKGYFTQDELCGGFSLQEYSGDPLTEELLTDKLKEQGLCSQIQNNENDDTGASISDCGSQNQIKFMKSSFDEGDVMILTYNATTDSTATTQEWVEVK